MGQPLNITVQADLGGAKDDQLSALIQTSDGGYIAGGKSASSTSGNKTDTCWGTYNYWVVKMNAVGAIQWQADLGGDNDDELQAIEQTTDGGYIVAGYSNSDSSGNKTSNPAGGYGSLDYDYWVVKLDSAGNIQWQKDIGGTGSDYLTSVKQTPDGGYILGGFSGSGASGNKTDASKGGNDYWVVKLDGTGNIKWQKDIGGDNDDGVTFYPCAVAIGLAADGGYIVGGTSNSDSSGDKTSNPVAGYSSFDFDYWILKLDSVGNIQWQKTIGGISPDALYSLAQTNDGGYIAGGSSYSGASGSKTDTCWGFVNYWVLKLNDSGNIQWQQDLGGDHFDQLYSFIQTNDGGYLAAGQSSSDSSGNKTSNPWAGYGSYTTDYWIVKLDVSGNIQWQKDIGSNSGSLLFAATQSADSGYVLGGATWSGISGDKDVTGYGSYSNDYWIVKLRFCNGSSVLSNVADSICPGSDYVLPGPRGVIVSSLGTYTDSLISLKGCDSVIILSLVNIIDTSVTTSGNTLIANSPGATYQWIECLTGKNVTGATSASFTPTLNDVYKVAITKNGCTEYSGCHIIDNVGVNYVALSDSLMVYPNPTRDNLYISLSNSNAPTRVQLYTLTGTAISDDTYSGTSIVLHLQQLGTGMYLLKIINGNSIRQMKIVKTE